MPRPNPWLGRGPLNFAHQGGAREAPSNTLFAFKTAFERGANALETDVHATADRHLVVIHDATVDRTANGSGRVDQMTLEDLKSLDAAYWWAPGHVTTRDLPEGGYPFRGAATGEKVPPEGYAVADFTIPTLREVLESFPDRYINMEIKTTAPEAEPYEKELADLLREFGRSDDVIVASFIDGAIERFREIAPEITTSAATVEATAFWQSAHGSTDEIDRVFVALQVPPEFGGLRVVDREFVGKAHAAGLAVHVWTVDEEELMEEFLALGVEGIITDRPSVLRSVIDRNARA